MSDSNKRRVVVTGLGAVTPVGNDVASTWQNACAAKSGIGEVTHFDASAHGTRIAGEVRGFDVEPWMPQRDARRMDTVVHYGVAAGMQAWADSGLDTTKQNADRIGLLVGSGIGGLRTIETTSVAMNEKGARKVSPFFIPGLMINMVSGYLSIQLGLRGLNLATATACTTSTHAIGLALRAIQYGDADVILAGGAEHACTPTAMAGFSSARAMSTRNDDPTRASRPWDKGRDGFVLADGSAVLVLEEREHALARGAKIYAELSGFGMSGDAHHITAPPEDGDGAARAMAHALADAGLAADGIDYLNAHATSTPLGDRAEVNAIKRVFGEHAYKLAVSSTKSITGHMLGAAGAIEALFSVLALHHGVVPPTANLDEPDEGCDLDFVPHTAREMKVRAAVSNSFGFGGTNGTLVFRSA
ncbi:beta-ketoacyl-ACP synthase II [Oleiagrimonas sp. C23AA]|uniref:beta-ketoacyl-ACP synthase II n=1 Tax=Oleiagrimonas sp. C23AA TaxID=2719047 RepID=UPI00142081C2|nr:beta-ketoacyl-ACP synthase II [Oleiagrimonas sp. C23AA]NII11488.1 beta-ketoacyl-ACP synthase II [Oleiagrimonas sp. C23AA]